MKSAFTNEIGTGCNHFKRNVERTHFKKGPYKRAYIVAMHKLIIPPCAVRQLMHCGGAAVGIEVPQYKPFYMVPQTLKHTYDKIRSSELLKPPKKIES